MVGRKLDFAVYGRASATCLDLPRAHASSGERGNTRRGILVAGVRARVERAGFRRQARNSMAIAPRARAGVTELGLENVFKKVHILKPPFRSGYENMTSINGSLDSSRTGFEGREATTPHNKKQEKNSCGSTRTSRKCLSSRISPSSAELPCGCLYTHRFCSC
jgi:hypothetical protein